MAAALVVAALVAAACAAAPAGASLDGRRFLSTSVTDHDVLRPLVAGTRIVLGFADGHVSAAAGCNTLGAAYRIDGGRLLIEGAGQTEMGCDPARQAQDEWLFDLLASRPAVALSGDELALEADGVVVRLLDREVADPDLPLIGPTWTVVSIIRGDAASSVPQGLVATLVFEAGGRVRIATGCNEGAATVTLADGTLRFRDVALTKRGCPAEAGQLESDIVALLNADAVAFTIDARSLELRADERGLQLSGG